MNYLIYSYEKYKKTQGGFNDMFKICWQFFKKSGSIEAYFYIHNKKSLLKKKEKKGDN